MKDKFKRELCHQLLTPLHQVVGFAYVINLEQDPLVREEYYSRLEIASVEITSKLKALIESADASAEEILRAIKEVS